jgi:hypothetical protein
MYPHFKHLFVTSVTFRNKKVGKLETFVSDFPTRIVFYEVG